MAGLVMVEALHPVKVRFKADGSKYDLQPGQRVSLPEPQARRLLEAVPDKIKVVTPEEERRTESIPDSPILPGWLIAWRDRSGRFCGGCDDRERGIVKTAAWGPTGWTFTVRNGEAVPLHAIVAVARTDEVGHVLGAWLVRECGPDGMRREG